MPQFQVNKQLLPMKAHYFLFNVGTGPIVPFLSVYARQLGFSSVIVGLVYTILPICGMLAKPIFGAIADRFHCQKKIFLLAQLLTAAAFLATYYSPKVPPSDNTVKFSCHNGEAGVSLLPNRSVDRDLLKQVVDRGVIAECQLSCPLKDPDWTLICDYWFNSTNCTSNHPENLQFKAQIPTADTQTIGEIIFPVNGTILDQPGGNNNENENFTPPICPNTFENISFNCNFTCNDEFLNKLTSVTSIANSDAYKLYQFWVFLLLMVLGWIGQAIVVSVSDAICFEILGDKPERYGYQRMFGALGWGIITGITGIIIDALSKGKADKDYRAAFYMAVFFMLMDFLVSYQLQYTQKKISSNIVKDVGRLLMDVRIAVYLVWCVSVGICTGIMWNFLFWLVEDLAKARGSNTADWIKTMQGLISAVQTLLGELPFFFLSGKILKAIGHVHAMSLVLFALAVRFTLYSVISDPWWFLPVELSSGITFGLFYAAMTSYASIVAPPGTETTMQGMVGAAFEGVGVSLGSFLAGLSYNKYGGPVTFRLFGVGAFIAFACHVVVQYLLSVQGRIRRRNDNSSSLEQEQLIISNQIQINYGSADIHT